MLAECEAPDSGLADLLLERGIVARATLKALLRSVVIDALVVLTTQLADETFVSGTRFRTPLPHWTAAYLRVPIDSISTAAARKSASLARFELATTCLPHLRDLEAPHAVLKAEHWAMADRIDGATSMRELARQCAIPLYEVVERVGYLIRKGLCATRDGEPSDSAGPAGPAVPAAAEPAPELLPSPPLPESRSSMSEVRAVRRPPPAPDAAEVAYPAELRQESPTPEQLRRVLEGLRKLS